MNAPVKLPDDPAQLARVVMEAITTLQNDVGGIRGLGEDTKSKVLDVLKKHEDLNSEVTKKWAEKAKAEADLQEKLVAAEKALGEMKKTDEGYQKRLADLELLMQAKTNAGTLDADVERQQPHYKGFFDFLKKNEPPSGRRDLFEFRPDVKAMEKDGEYKTLRTDSDVQGGYLVPLITDNEIRKNITEMSPVRMFARVRQATSKTMEIPRRLAIPTAVYEGEGETSPSDQSQYGSEQVTLYRQTVTIPATLDMMVSSAFNLEQEIAMDVGEAFGKGEGMNFISGTGVKGPQGIIKDSRIEQVNTSGSGAVIWDDLITIASKLKRGQNPAFFFNRRTLGILQKLKSTIGVPIWAPVAGDKPATIWGFPYNSDMIELADADAGTGALPIVFGDLRRGYEIYDLIGISVVRDDLTRKKEAITEWTFRRYNTGRVIIPEAIKVLKVA